MALSSSHCLPHIKTRLWGLDYPTVYVVCLILPQLFKIYLILSYRHLNSLTSGTFIPTPHNKFIHGPYLAFFFNHLQLFVFWKLKPQYFTFSEPLPVSSLCVSFHTQHFTSLMFLIPGGLFLHKLSFVFWIHFFLHQVHWPCLYWLFSYSYSLLPFCDSGFARTWLWVALHSVSNVVASYNSHFFKCSNIIRHRL